VTLAREPLQHRLRKDREDASYDHGKHIGQDHEHIYYYDSNEQTRNATSVVRRCAGTLPGGCSMMLPLASPVISPQVTTSGQMPGATGRMQGADRPDGS
jgi:hypothetical protein